MNKLTIFTDLGLTAEQRAFLEASVAPHRMLYPEKAAASVLANVETDERMQEAEVVFGQPQVAALMRSEKVRWVQVSSAGYTRYDRAEMRAWCEAKGVVVSNSSAVYDQPCAEHALAFMLAQARQLPQGLATVCANGSESWWEIRRNSRLLMGQSVLLVGYGSIAERLIDLLEPFECRIVAARRTVRGDERVETVAMEEVEDRLGEFDHVVNLLPDNAESVKWFEASRFARMKRGVVFSNIGRGTTVCQEALVEGLRSGQVGAAWLDVTDPEPLPEGHALWSEPNAFITPHTAGGQGGETDVLLRHFVSNFRRYLKGEAVKNRVMGPVS